MYHKSQQRKIFILSSSLNAVHHKNGEFHDFLATDFVIQAFLNFRGFDFRGFDFRGFGFNAVYNSILISSPFGTTK